MFKEKKENKYITKAGLRGKRGWTDKLIKDFLKEPDSWADNPYYKSMPPMGLYLLTRVYEIENSGVFKMAQESARLRKQTAARAVNTKRMNIMNYVENIKIELPEIEYETLIQHACNSYNNFSRHLAYEREIERELATPDSDTEFLNRICLNYLRHQCTKYEDQLARIYGKVGTEQAHEVLKLKVNEYILEKYPQLR